MRHRFWTLALLVTVTSAHAETTCYSIELWSVPINRAADAPHIEGCALLQIGAHRTLRCGCFETQAQAKQALSAFKPRFADAALCKTLRSRFDAPIASVSPSKPNPPAFALVQRRSLADALHVSGHPDQTPLGRAAQQHPFEIAPLDPPQWYDALFVEGSYIQQFNGTYATRQYTDYEYTLSFGVDLFKGGLQELKHNHSRLQAQSAYEQRKETELFETYRQELQLTQIEQLRNRVEAAYAATMEALLDETLATLHLQLSQLLITRFDISQKERDHARFKALKTLYDQNLSWPAWIETIEQAQLPDHSALQERLSGLNAELLSEEAKIRLFSLETSYLDTTDMQLYLTRRSVDELGSYDAVGFKAKLPLNFQRQAEANRHTLLQKEITMARKERLLESMRLRLQEQIEAFEQSRQAINAAKAQITSLDQAYEDLQTLHQNSIANLPIKPLEEAYNLVSERIGLERELYMQRLSMLVALVHIARFTQTEPPLALLEH